MRHGLPGRKRREARMAEISVSATESALENQQLGALQIRVAAICTLIQMCDGYDVGSIGWAVPSLTHAWHVAPSAFALAFLGSNLGVMGGPCCPDRSATASGAS